MSAGGETPQGAGGALETPAGQPRLRVLIVDDHDVVHWGFRTMLGNQPWVERTLSARTGAEAYELATRYKPDVALVDLFIGEESGPEISAQLRERSPMTHVLLISGAGRISNSSGASLTTTHWSACCHQRPSDSGSLASTFVCSHSRLTSPEPMASSGDLFAPVEPTVDHAKRWKRQLLGRLRPDRDGQEVGGIRERPAGQIGAQGGEPEAGDEDGPGRDIRFRSQ